MKLIAPHLRADAVLDHWLRRAGECITTLRNAVAFDESGNIVHPAKRLPRRSEKFGEQINGLISCVCETNGSCVCAAVQLWSPFDCGSRVAAGIEHDLFLMLHMRLCHVRMSNSMC